MKRAVLMARVSSDEQAKGYSLDVQEESLRRHCARNGIAIVHIFREDHSAKSFDRPQFHKFLEFLKANKGTVDLLLFTTWDRFSRNVSEAYQMIDRLKKYGVEPQAAEQPLDLSVPENKAILAIYLVMPEIDNDRRAIKITGGIRAAWKAGRWTHKAPIGYKNSRDESNKPLLKPSEDAKLIRYVFEETAKGRPHVEIRMEVNKKGLYITRPNFSVVLRNPLYMGMIPYPAENGQPAYLIKAVHEPIITPELFQKVQETINGAFKRRNRPKVIVRREELILRGLLVCSHCGAIMTGSASRSKTGTRYFYYHCNACTKDRIRADFANATIEKILAELKFKKTAKQLYRELLACELENAIEEKQAHNKTSDANLLKLQQRLENLQDMLVDEKISHADYATMKARYEKDIATIKASAFELKGVENERAAKLEKGISQIMQLSNLYKSYDLNARVRLLSSILPAKISFSEEKCRTPRLNEVLRRCLNIDKGFAINENRQPLKNLELSTLVDPERIELSSKQALNMLSTCLAPY